MNTARVVLRAHTDREVVHFRTNGTQGRLLWDTREVEPGTYMAELIGAAEPLVPIRVVVKH